MGTAVDQQHPRYLLQAPIMIIAHWVMAHWLMTIIAHSGPIKNSNRFMSQSEPSSQPQPQPPSLASTQSQPQAMPSSQHMLSLLQFQDQLLQLVHSQVYHSKPITDQCLLRFQINHLSDVDETWRKMVEQLEFKLVRQKMHYEGTLRDYFQRVLNVDYLGLLRVRKYELTQVALFGFDIYVEPLTAVLEILNRIDGQALLAKTKHTAEMPQVWRERSREIWEAVREGWDSFMYETALCKISLNVYLLCEYLKLSAKSLSKKDKQIIFTGAYNIFSQLVPALKNNGQGWLLCELSLLNNQLYNFHPSFNYSHFFSLLAPLHTRYQSIFRPIAQVAQKCLRANVLTPLLFALLRNRQAFLTFIQQVDDPVWVPYLNGIVTGLVYNFKTRILEYRQVLEVMKAAVLKLGVLGGLQIGGLVGQLGKEWAEARDFFISALKVGYGVGELQTWHAIDHETLQPEIIDSVRQSLLMHAALPEGTPMELFFPDGLAVEFQACLLKLNSLLNVHQLTTNFSPNVAEAVEIGPSQLGDILKLVHLIKLNKQEENVNCVCYVLSFLNKITDVRSASLGRRLQQIGAHYFTIVVNRLHQGLSTNSDLKQVVFAYIKRAKPSTMLRQTLAVCLTVAAPKQATLQVLALAQTHPHPCIVSACALVSAFTPAALTNKICLKTFEKSYEIPHEPLYINSRLHLCLSALIEQVMWHEDPLPMQTLLWLARLQNWLAIPILNFPVCGKLNKEDKSSMLQSFGNWLSCNPDRYGILEELVGIGLGLQGQLGVYFQEIALVGLAEQLVQEINRVLGELVSLQDNSQYVYLLKLVEMLVKLYMRLPRSPTEQPICKITKLYLRCLSRIDLHLNTAEDPQLITHIAGSLLSVYSTLLELLFTGEQSQSRQWRKAMWKTCLSAIDLNVEHVVNARECELPSLRKDRGFLINSPVELGGKGEPGSGFGGTWGRIPGYESKAQEYEKSDRRDKIDISGQQYVSESYMLEPEQIRQFSLTNKTDVYYSKQYLLPGLSPKLLGSLLAANPHSDILANLLAMTPSNHRRLSELALHNPTYLNLLPKLGLTKQSVSSLLPVIITQYPEQQLASLTMHLDPLAQQHLADNFNLMLLQQQAHRVQPGLSDSTLLCRLSQALSFLLLQGQTNWRYANQVLVELGQREHLAATASVLLQYVEYVRITGAGNEEYNTRVEFYSVMLGCYAELLAGKYRQLQAMEETITKDQHTMFMTNQLAYIRGVLQAWAVREVLQRCTHVMKQLAAMGHDPEAILGPMHGHINSIISKAGQINEVVNEMSGGEVLVPDFVQSYRLCSGGAVEGAKIELGEWLEGWLEGEYRPKGRPVQVQELESLQQLGQVLVRVQVSNRPQSVDKLIHSKYNQLLQQLVTQQVLIITEGTLHPAPTLTPQSLQAASGQVSLLGVYHSLMLQTQQNPHLVFPLLQQCLTRSRLDWQLIKAHDPQLYHQIKSILLDEQVQSRKIKFVHEECALVPQGAGVEVNRINKEKYCNLLARRVLGVEFGVAGAWMRGSTRTG